MEQISASIAKFILAKCDEPVFPYYNDLKKNFRVPAVYFPEFENDNGPSSLDSYDMSYSWFIKFFHSTTGNAYRLAKIVLDKLVGGRYYIPIADEKGNDTGRKIRIKRAEIKKVDDGVYQMWLEWSEIYEYDDVSGSQEKMQTYDISCNLKE